MPLAGRETKRLQKCPSYVLRLEREKEREKERKKERKKEREREKERKKERKKINKRDHLQSTSGIICGSGSFAVGNHLQCCTILSLNCVVREINFYV